MPGRPRRRAARLALPALCAAAAALLRIGRGGAFLTQRPAPRAAVARRAAARQAKEAPADGRTGRAKKRKRRLKRYPILFPYLEVNATTSPAALAKQVSRTFDHSGIVELYLVGQGSRIKALYALAQAPLRNASAQIAPRRRDSRARLLVSKGAFADGAGDREVCRVSAATDPEKLAQRMRLALRGRYHGDPEQRGVELRAAGPGAAAVALFALEQVRFTSWSDVRFAAHFGEYGDPPLSGLVVTVGICSSNAAEEAEVPEPEADPDAEEAELPQVRWTPQLHADLFPTLFVGNRTGSMGLGTKLAATLSVCTTRIVELLLTDKTARSRLLYTLASLPPWLQAAGQVAPRREDSRSRFRVVRDYPLQGEPEAEGPQLRVSSGTEPEKLAAALIARLLDRDWPEEAVEMRFVGPEAASRALLGLEHLHAVSKREVTFWPRFVVLRKDVRGLVVTVAAT